MSCRKESTHHRACDCREGQFRKLEAELSETNEQLAVCRAERDAVHNALSEARKVIEERGYAFQEAVQKALAERDRMRNGLDCIRALVPMNLNYDQYLKEVLKYVRQALSPQTKEGGEA